MPYRVPTGLPPTSVGDVFGRLTVLSFTDRRGPNRGRFCLCRCECGAELEILNSSLRSGNSTSCGCFSADAAAARRTVHGHTSRRTHGRRSKAYQCWTGIHARCSNPAATGYEFYGARGIRVCDEWSDFAVFYADMGDPPPGRSIDRKDNSKGYSKENCRWATRSEQRANQRPVSRQSLHRNNASGYRGVCWNARKGKWKAGIKVGNTSFNLGDFPDAALAGEAYIRAAKIIQETGTFDRSLYIKPQLA